jgi:hypothetical protein
VSTESLTISSQLPSLRLPDRSWQKWLSAAISLALLGAILLQFNRIGMARLRDALPTAPGFWIALAAYYLALPASEWLIYRRLWALPGSGFAALLRKLVSNEVLLGYSGEVAFYGWARARMRLASTPFGAIKDVSVTSALAGNIATLLMMTAAWPFLDRLHLPVSGHQLAASVIAVIALTAAVGFFKWRIFSLPARDLRYVMAVHLARVALTTALSALLWHFALPEVALSTWILLAALQLLVTRLPLVPNKDLVFAATTCWVVGAASGIGPLIALVSALILAAHLMIGAALAIVDLFDAADAA